MTEFAEPWEAQVHALAVTLSDAGLFAWSEWTQAIGAAPESGERPLVALERLVTERGLADAATLERYRDAWARAAERTPHGAPIELSDADFGEAELSRRSAPRPR